MFRHGVIILALLSAGSCSDMCKNTLIATAQAPDGLHAAVMFQRDCGATTGFSTQVSLLEPGDKVTTGNAFVADDNHGAAAAGPSGGPWAEIKWLAADHLLIRYAAKSRIFEHDEEVSGVRITHQAVAI